MNLLNEMNEEEELIVNVSKESSHHRMIAQL
jgi:hypothetical protein